MQLSRRSFHHLLAALPLAAMVLPAFAAEGTTLHPGARVAIVGDSITEQKLYSKYAECYLLASSGVPDVTVFQFGWGGETAGGFAGRLENDLGAFKPNIVTLCYGMNDGGYQPWKDQIGTGYEGNMRNVVKKLEAFGVKRIVVGSPGAVDTKFFGPRPNFGTQNSADGYNDTLAHLRDIDRKLAEEHKQLFADVHQAMIDAMKKAKAEKGEAYDVCGGDGFHPGPNGQLVMAYAFLKALGCDGNIGAINVDLKAQATATDGHKVVSAKDGTVEIESSRWPFSFEGDGKGSSSTRSIVPYFPFNQDLNRLTLKVSNLDTPKAKVTWGAESKEFTKEQLTAGINLPAEFAVSPFEPAAQKLSQAVANKQGFETTMIKQIITNFRSYPAEVKSDPEAQQAIGVLTNRLIARWKQLDEEAKKTVVPVKHQIVITPQA